MATAAGVHLGNRGQPGDTAGGHPGHCEKRAAGTSALILTSRAGVGTAFHQAVRGRRSRPRGRSWERGELTPAEQAEQNSSGRGGFRPPRTSVASEFAQIELDVRRGVRGARPVDRASAAPAGRQPVLPQEPEVHLPRPGLGRALRGPPQAPLPGAARRGCPHRAAQVRASPLAEMLHPSCARHCIPVPYAGV